MNSLFALITTPMIAMAAVGAFVSAYNQSQMDAKLTQILTACQQPKQAGNLPQWALQSARYST